MIWLKTKKVNYASSVLGFVSWQTGDSSCCCGMQLKIWNNQIYVIDRLVLWIPQITEGFQLGQYERTKHDSTSIAWGLVNKLGINCRGRGEQGSKGGGLGLGLVEITNFTKLSGKFQPETRKCFSFITILHCSQISDASNIWYWFNWRFSLHDRILEELTLGRWLKWLTVRSKESQQSGSRCRGSLPGGRSSILTISRNK